MAVVKAIKKMSDRDYQIKTISAIYGCAFFTPVFKLNKKYMQEKKSNLIPFIAKVDLENKKFVIRGTDDYENNIESNTLIAEYETVQELVDDGWKLKIDFFFLG